MIMPGRRSTTLDYSSIYVGDLNWRLALRSGDQTACRPATGPHAGSMLLSEPVAAGVVEHLAGDGGVLADLFSTAHLA